MLAIFVALLLAFALGVIAGRDVVLNQQEFKAGLDRLDGERARADWCVRVARANAYRRARVRYTGFDRLGAEVRRAQDRDLAEWAAKGGRIGDGGDAA